METIEENIKGEKEEDKIDDKKEGNENNNENKKKEEEQNKEDTENKDKEDIKDNQTNNDAKESHNNEKAKNEIKKYRFITIGNNLNNNINNEDAPYTLGTNAEKKSDNSNRIKNKENIPNKIRSNPRFKRSQINKERFVHKLSIHFKKNINDDDVPDIL